MTNRKTLGPCESYVVVYILNRRQRSLKCSKDVSQPPYVGLDHFHKNPKKIAGNLPAKMPDKRYLSGDSEETSPFEASVEGHNWENPKFLVNYHNRLQKTTIVYYTAMERFHGIVVCPM